MANMTLEKLALMIKNSFDHVEGRFQDVYTELAGLKQGQEEILLKLDRYAYKFEIQDLKKRVDRIEKITGI